MNNPLATDNHIKLARSLVDMMLENIRADQSLGGDVIADKIVALQAVIWPENGEYPDIKTERRVFKEVLEDLNASEKSQLFEAYARMGHLYEIAGLAARHHFFKKNKVPGGVADFAKIAGTAEDAVSKLNQPVFEVVMTMHPTNTHSLESMQAQRELIKAVEAADVDKAKQAMRMVLDTPVLHEKYGEDANFTVRDETAVVVHFLNNLYEDMTAVYSDYDDALRKQFRTAYKPEELNLKLKLGSWGSAGDKDGNNNVTAETTLEAIAMHTAAIVARYKADVETIHNPALAGWQEKLTAANTALQAILPEVAQLREDSTKARKNDANISGKDLSDRFDALSKKLVDIRKPLDAKVFEKDVSAAQAESGDPMALDLLRKIRIFGFDFSKIEYRETAEEYGRVAAELIPRYGSMSAEQRKNELTKLLSQQGDDPQYLLSAVKHKIIDAANKPYTKDSALPIAYHTMKRMELARDFPTMIQDNVLAECGRADGEHHSPQEVAAQGTANILEAQLMQRMTVEKDGRKVKLGIIPLFEEPDTMMNIDVIMRSAYENEAYKQHLELMKDRHEGKPTQQVQIAHSDNARRSGLLAARAYIHEAHKKMRALNKEMGIETQFFEGGSISDAYRNGVRAVSASVNAFNLHDFAKFTFQGGDLVNYFTAPSSTVRLLTRNIPHAATRFYKDVDGWKIRNRADDISKDVDKERRQPYQLLDEIAIAALKDTLKEYQDQDFQKDKMGVMLAVLDYNGETTAGARGSRAAARGGQPVAFANVTSTKAAIIKPRDMLKDIKPIDIEKVRTISFSEAWQHAGIVPSWLGSKNLGKHLLAETKKHLDDIKNSTNQTIKNQLGTITETTASLTPEQVHLFFERSPTFRDAEDRSAFALAMTDPNSLDWIAKRLDLMETMHVHPEMVAQGRAYLKHVRETYDEAAKLAHEAHEGKVLEGEPRSAIAKALYRLTEDIERKSHYRDFLLYAKIQGTSDHDRGVIHNAGDTVVHGRFLTADDPAYGEERYPNPSVGAAAAVRC